LQQIVNVGETLSICHNKDETPENSLIINPKTWKKKGLNPLKIDVDSNFQQQLTTTQN